MKVGFVGLGKLGYPVAVAMQSRGHDVMGYDVVAQNMTNDPRDAQEKGAGMVSFNDWAEHHPIQFGEISDVATHAEIIFVAVQTPHDPMYEGTTRLPRDRRDFDYSFLAVALSDLALAITHTTTVVVISTVLPGTFGLELKPIINRNPKMRLCYNPFFIAMGTVVWDFFNPEFVLCGADREEAADHLESFYKTIHRSQMRRMPPFCRMSIPSAEATKVFYNTFISQKIAFANTVMEVCHKIPGCDVDDVQNTLKLATDRLISPAYMTGGMGDGGGCHPRDNIALSWLARKLKISHDIFEDTMLAREHQAEWMAGMMKNIMETNDLPLAIVGTAFKAGTDIETGSAAILVKNILWEWGIFVDVFHSKTKPIGDVPRVFLIGVKEPAYAKQVWPKGSVVIDPHRYIPEQDGVEVIHLGVGK